MIADFHFLRPFWLLALLAPPAMLWMAARSSDLRNQWKGMIAPHLLDSLIVEPAHERGYYPAWIMAIIMTLAALGAAGPTWKREAPPFVSDTASLVIAVDLSQTMDAIDITPSRIERAKLKIHDILAGRNGARTAVVAYAGSAHLVVPLTDDIDLIETYTDALATRIMPKPGRDTAAAVTLADGLMQRDGAAGTIVLLTDGIEPGAAATLKGIKSGMAVLGIGTPEGGIIKPPGGGPVSDNGGARPSSKLDAAALKAFGSDTGADVATVTSDDADIRWLAQRIRTNFSEQTADQGDRWHDLGWWLIIPAVLLSIFSFRRGWLVKLAVMTLSVRLLLPSPATADELADMWLTPDQQGRLAFEKDHFAEAAQHFRDPMWKGAALYKAAQYQDALDAFASVDSPESWYNQGNALLHLGDFTEAIAAYGKALEQRKDWPDATANLSVAQRLLKQQQDKEQEQEQDPNQKPDSIQFDDKGKKGKAGEVAAAEQTSEMWMKNIQVSPADLLARKFSLEEDKAQK